MGEEGDVGRGGRKGMGGGRNTLGEAILVRLEFLLEFADVARVFVEEDLAFRCSISVRLPLVR